MISWLDRLPRRAKQLLVLTVDAGCLALSMWLALAARLESWWPEVGGHSLIWVCASATIIGIPCCYTAGLYREITRYVGLRFAVHVAYAVTATVFILAFVVLMTDRGAGFPRSAIIGFWMAALLAIGGSRAVARYLIRRSVQPYSTRMIVYGAGDVGAGLVSMLAQDQRSTIVAFVDDDPLRVGTEVRSLRVYAASDIRKVVRALRVSTILLALPESSRRRRREVFQELTMLGLKVMLVPTLNEIADGTARTDAVRVMKIEDLLGRNPVEAKTALLSRNIGGANVLVTGAGGSIGSEIARQVLRQGPRRLVVLDNCEFNLYTIENELRRLVGEASGVQIVAVLGSVLDRVRIEQVIGENKIESIYHAAAYKHVPIVESNEIEGVAVNVIGTLRTAQAAEQLGVRTFVLISTDKAVRPTSVMGASKRLAEKCLQALADHAQRASQKPNRTERRTRFAMVRFGNVLASSGSVVPLFTEQIRRGGPVTLTHPDITRYFMTIPEASSLVIQAGAMGKGGDVFVLDMGEPVKIIDLARSMIRLAGYSEKSDANPHGDIEILTTGLRPGEKLFEELLIGDNCGPTEHPAIMQAQERFIPWQTLEPSLTRLEAALDQHDVPGVRALLEQLVSGYHESLALAGNRGVFSDRPEGFANDS
ncbi:MAG: polysaccharide biosynthesis protein [Phycisphaerales bacterium]|nr:polysaccharide biosynthesis protein [Phycisphaerales bacterium]